MPILEDQNKIILGFPSAFVQVKHKPQASSGYWIWRSMLEQGKKKPLPVTWTSQYESWNLPAHKALPQLTKNTRERVSWKGRASAWILMRYLEPVCFWVLMHIIHSKAAGAWGLSSVLLMQELSQALQCLAVPILAPHSAWFSSFPLYLPVCHACLLSSSRGSPAAKHCKWDWLTRSAGIALHTH